MKTTAFAAMTSYRSTLSPSKSEEIPLQDMEREQRRKSWEKTASGRQGTEESNTTLPVYRNPLDENGSAQFINPLDKNGSGQFNAPVKTAEDLATEVIHAVDDPDLNPVCNDFRYEINAFSNVIMIVDISGMVSRSDSVHSAFDLKALTKSGIGLSTFGGSLGTTSKPGAFHVLIQMHSHYLLL